MVALICRTAKIANNGELTIGKRNVHIPCPMELRVGGLYDLHGRLYKVVGLEMI